VADAYNLFPGLQGIIRFLKWASKRLINSL
jgi:hypothetical protein